MFKTKKVCTVLMFILLVLGFYTYGSSGSFSITISVTEGCTSTAPSTTSYATPNGDYLVTATITTTSAFADVNCTLNADGWTFQNDYPQTINIGAMGVDETYDAQWFAAVPLTEGDYTISVTVSATGISDYTTDTATVTVTYDIYGFETTSTDISDDLYAYTDKTYATQITTVDHNSIIYLRGVDGLTDNSYLLGFFHIVYDGETYDTVVDTIEKPCAIINEEICVELDLSKVDGGKLRENGSYYIHMSAKDNLTVDSTRIYGTTQTFTYDVSEGHERIEITPPPVTETPETPIQAGFRIPPLFFLIGVFLLGIVVHEFV